MIVREQSIFLLAIHEYVSFHGYEWHTSGTLDSHLNHFNQFMAELGCYETNITQKADERKEGFIRNFVPPRAKTQIFVYPDEVEGIIRWVLLSKKQLPIPKKYGVMHRVDEPNFSLVLNNLRLSPSKVESKNGSLKTVYYWHINHLWFEKILEKFTQGVIKKSNHTIKYYLQQFSRYALVPNTTKDVAAFIHRAENILQVHNYNYDIKAEFNFKFFKNFYNAPLKIISQTTLLKICKRSAMHYRTESERILHPSITKKTTPEERAFLIARMKEHRIYLGYKERKEKARIKEEERQMELHRQQVQAKREAKLAKKLEESIDRILEMHDCDL